MSMLLISSAFADDISAVSGTATLNSVVVGEPETVKTLIDEDVECDIIVSGSAVKLSDEEYGEIPAGRASQPDLMVTAINSAGTYPFEALGDAKIEVKISNRGTAAANKFYFGIYVDNVSIGKGYISSLAAGYAYSAEITLSNIKEGSHAIKVDADADNSVAESNEGNNTMTKSFTWKGTPDLAAEIAGGPANNSNVDGESSFQFKFYVKNVGNGGASKISVAITVGDSYLTTSIDSTLPAKSETYLPVTVTFYGYGKNNVELKVNRDKTIAESNYGNNTATKTYNVVYCTHFLGHNKFSAAGAKNIKFFVTASAKEYFPDIDYDRFSEWNNVTNNVIIKRVNTKSDADFYVEGIELKKASTLGYTVPNLRTIQLNIQKGSLMDEPIEEQTRTYLHEMGHALGLGHPRTEESEPSCGYAALMCQTWDSEHIAFEPSSHDKYNLLKLYE